MLTAKRICKALCRSARSLFLEALADPQKEISVARQTFPKAIDSRGSFSDRSESPHHPDQNRWPRGVLAGAQPHRRHRVHGKSPRLSIESKGTRRVGKWTAQRLHEDENGAIPDPFCRWAFLVKMFPLQYLGRRLWHWVARSADETVGLRVWPPLLSAARAADQNRCGRGTSLRRLAPIQVHFHAAQDGL